jgi:hypothetical protein
VNPPNRFRLLSKLALAQEPPLLRKRNPERADVGQIFAVYWIKSKLAVNNL